MELKSVGMIFNSQLNGKSFRIPWFQSPATSWDDGIMMGGLDDDDNCGITDDGLY